MRNQDGELLSLLLRKDPRLCHHSQAEVLRCTCPNLLSSSTASSTRCHRTQGFLSHGFPSGPEAQSFEVHSCVQLARRLERSGVKLTLPTCPEMHLVGAVPSHCNNTQTHTYTHMQIHTHSHPLP